MRLLAWGLSGFATLAAVGCGTDEPTSTKTVPVLRSALLDGPSILSQAEAATLGRGEQDFLVRFERSLPGFGGLFIGDNGVNVYLKGSIVKPDVVRQTLAKAYSVHPNALVREALAGVSNAAILPARYSLSELIAIEKRLASNPGVPIGYVGAGVSIRQNRVKVMFADSTALLRASPNIAANGVPLDAVDLIVTGPAHLENGGFDATFRPTGGGIQIQVGNDTRYPGYTTCCLNGFPYYVYHFYEGSLGFNVQAASGNYILTASHLANQFSGLNGAVGDTIWQGKDALSRPSFVAVVMQNPAWNEGAACDVNPVTRTNFDFCTTADVMLAGYRPGITYARRIATSVYGGINGNVGSGGFKQFNDVVNVFPPEYVHDSLHKDANKTGETTSTTSGEIVSEMGFADFNICWPARDPCTPTKWLRLLNVAAVHATSGGGDSGSPVFSASSSRNGAPYAALGILNAGLGVGNPCTGSTCYFYFARWDQIEPRLGMGTLNPRTTIP